MSAGPGKYGDECGEALRATQAETVMLIVIRGNRGSGFSFAHVGDSFTLHSVPPVLRDIAEQIERDIVKGTH